MNGSAIITALAGPVIKTNISDVSSCPFNQVSLSVIAEGTGLTYQWQYSMAGSEFTALSDPSPMENTYQGASTANSYSASLLCKLRIRRSKVPLRDKQQFRMPGTLQYGNPDSDKRSANVIQVTGGGNACSSAGGVSVGLDGSESGTSYELLKNGTSTRVSIAGKGSALSFGNQSFSGTYTVVAVKSGCRSNMVGSAVVQILTTLLPVISTQPANTSACPGQQATFSVAASGDNPTYQWQLFISSISEAVDLNQTYIDMMNAAYNSNSGTAYVSMQGFNSPTLTVSSLVSFNNGAQLQCKVSNSAGCSVLSSGATLTIKEAPTVAENVSGGGPYCAGSTGATIYLASAENGITYELWRDGYYNQHKCYSNIRLCFICTSNCSRNLHSCRCKKRLQA